MLILYIILLGKNWSWLSSKAIYCCFVGNPKCNWTKGIANVGTEFVEIDGEKVHIAYSNIQDICNNLLYEFIVCISYNTCNSVLPDIYTRNLRVSTYISGKPRVPVLQLICYTSSTLKICPYPKATARLAYNSNRCWLWLWEIF